MPNTASASLIGGLLHGYTSAKADQAHQELDKNILQQKNVMAYLHEIANNEGIPPEHRQWALGQLSTLTQHPVGKPLPKGVGDLSQLPAVNIQQPNRQAVVPGQSPITLTPPTPPSGGDGQSPQPPTGQSSQVGRDASGSVNVLGATPAGGGFGTGPGLGLGSLQAPTPPPNLAVAQSPVTIPAVSGPSTVANPTPPTQIAPAGGLHILTPEDRQQYASAAQGQHLNELQQRYPGKSPEELAYFSQHGEFPKPDSFTLGPQQQRFTAGKLVAENTNDKSGTKSGYEFDLNTGGVKDLSRGGAILTPEQIANNPEAKSVYTQGKQERDRRETQTEAKENRQSDRAIDRQARSFQNATDQKIQGDAIKASRQVAPLTSVLKTAEDYQKSGQFTPRKDLSLVVNAVRAMNPGSVRLPGLELQKEFTAGSYTDQFRRWYSTAQSGLLPADQRNDLMNVIRDETTNTAANAAETWKQAFEGKKPLPPHLKRFDSSQQLKPPSAPGDTATSAASHPDTHIFSSSAYKAAKPNGNLAAAEAAAKKNGYTIIP